MVRLSSRDVFSSASHLTPISRIREYACHRESQTRRHSGVPHRIWGHGTVFSLCRRLDDILILHIIQGLSTFYGNPLPDEERFKLLDAVLESGSNYWDSADIYGDSEDLLGKWYAILSLFEQV